MNSTMRSIDLSTYILAPVLVGQIITFTSKITGAWFITGWNVISGALVYYLQARIYSEVPKLAEKKIIGPKVSNGGVEKSRNYGSISSPLECVTATMMTIPMNSNTEIKKAPTWYKKLFFRLKSEAREFWVGWKDYWQSPVRNAGLGLSMLYMTVLGFDNVTNGRWNQL